MLVADDSIIPYVLPRLLFLENGTHKCISVIDINDIETVEPITISETMRPRGVTAIKITSERKFSWFSLLK